MNDDSVDRARRRDSHDGWHTQEYVPIRPAYRVDPDANSFEARWRYLLIAAAGALVALVGCLWVYFHLPSYMR